MKKIRISTVNIVFLLSGSITGYLVGNDSSVSRQAAKDFVIESKAGNSTNQQKYAAPFEPASSQQNDLAIGAENEIFATDISDTTSSQSSTLNFDDHDQLMSELNGNLPPPSLVPDEDASEPVNTENLLEIEDKEAMMMFEEELLGTDSAITADHDLSLLPEEQFPPPAY